MAPAACHRIPFLPARARGHSTNPAATSVLPRRPSLKCSAANGDNSKPHSISISPTSPPRPRATVADGVESVDANGLRRPTVPVSGLTVPGARDPHWLPRKLSGRGRCSR